MKKLLILWLAATSSLAQVVQAPFTKQPLPGAAVATPTKVAAPVATSRKGPNGGTPISNTVVVGGPMSLTSDSRLSMVIINSSGQTIRTAQANVERSAGAVDISRAWDGKDDDGVLAPAGSYSLVGVASNIQHNPEGTFANNTITVKSTGLPATRNGNYIFTNDMVIASDGAVYQADGFAEARSSVKIWNVSNPLSASWFRPDGLDMSVTDVAEDGVKLWQLGHKMDQGGPPAYTTGSPESGVRASLLSNRANYTFTGVATTMAPIFADQNYVPFSVAAYRNSKDYRPRGIAVLRTGTLMFVAYPARNEIHVFNKNTGVALSIQTVTAPSKMMVDYSERLWVVTGTNVTRYGVDASTGALTPQLTLTGLVAPMAVAISKNNTQVAIADGGSSQQVKFYTIDGAVSGSPIGVAGGYTTDPNVNNNKFYFSDASGSIYKTFLAYEPNGSIWVGDVGNFRLQHYSAARAYVDRVQWMPNCYSLFVNQTDATQVFAQFLEYKIDYTKGLYEAGAWELVRNYRAGFPTAYFQLTNLYQNIQIESALADVTTFADGRRFALSLRQDKSVTVVELPTNGPARLTGRTFPESEQLRMTKDGTLYGSTTDGSVPPPTYRLKRRLRGAYDGNNDPTYGALTTIHSFAYTSTDAVNHSGGPAPFTFSSTGDLITFDANIKPYPDNTGYHLGLRQMALNRYKWQGALATHSYYQGDYPTDGRYDIGNGPFGEGPQYGGATRLGIARGTVWWTYRGENWKNGQTNKIQFVDEIYGAPLGTFGLTSKESTATGNWLGNAGNVFYWEVVEGPDGNVYGYHAEEGPHYALHRHQFTGFNTVYRMVVPVTVTATADPRGFDILADVPRVKSLVSGQDNIFKNFTDGGELLGFSSVEDYDRVNSPSVTLGNNNSSGDRILRKTFPAGALFTGLNAWSMTLDYNYVKNYMNVNEYGQAGSGGMYLRIKDNAGKVLIQIAHKQAANNNQQITVNGTQIALGFNIITSFVPITFTVTGNNIVVKYGNFPAVTVAKLDNTAALGSPAAVEQFAWINPGDGNNVGRLSTIRNVWFKPN